MKRVIERYWGWLLLANVLLGAATAAQGARTKPISVRQGIEGELGYSIVALGDVSSVEALNDNGIAVGYQLPRPGEERSTPLLWTNGLPTPLPGIGQGGGWAHDINNARQIAGWTLDESFHFRPVRWEDGVALDLGRLGTGTSGKALAINEAGLVVGWSSISPGHLPQAFLADGKSMWPMGPSGPFRSEARGINDRGQVVGFYCDAGEEHAFLNQNGFLRELDGLDSPRDARALDVNDSGTVVGFTVQNGHGCCEETVWRVDPNGRLPGRLASDLGSPGNNVNRAFAVSERGHVVGNTNGQAFLWQSGFFLNLNDIVPSGSDWWLIEAKGVNCYGQIVGVGTFRGDPQGYLFSPLPHLLVDDEVEEGAEVHGSFVARAGDRYMIFRAEESGRTKAVADGMPVIVDLGPFGQQPELVASGTVGESGSVQLTLPVPSGEERVYWQGLVLVGDVVHLGNRMETLIRQAP